MARSYNGVEIPDVGTYAFDPTHTVVGAVARHLMVTKVRGHFKEVTGSITVAEDPLASSVEVHIKAASIETGVQQRDDHLRGADFLDVGAESTRPGARPVPADEEQARLLPVLERLLAEVPCPISVDTAKPEVAEAALARGAHLVNDVTGLAGGSTLAAACARHGAGLVLVHMRGTPATMQQAPHYDDLLGEVRGFLAAAVATAEAAGVPPDAICVDPGLGFGKTVAHNLTLLRRLDVLAGLGKPADNVAAEKAGAARDGDAHGWCPFAKLLRDPRWHTATHLPSAGYLRPGS